ncbi:glycosyltransferase family 4 protein [Labilibaculum sp. DW002]|uniref:Glycosyltransferase family 4 protein n=1 Tax=Paralabilibaculum antarcticum TaxID=2912572 RepID=A0ABT5VQ50_9BACT|nr:glycosyltransferase family 4 protein [Labilibaculum sp. DW002]MDE5417559.1 glycosyltransferase family 4 protein [Labilibaculum sp. DW002]
MKIILSHPTGNANSRAAVQACAKAGLLYRFYTAIAVFSGTVLYKIGFVKPMAELHKREFNSLLKGVTYTHPWREIGRLLVSKFGFKKLIKHEKGMFCVDQVYKSLDEKIASSLEQAMKQGSTGVYAYEDGAAATFQEATKLGLDCLYDLPIGYWRSARKLLLEEKEQRPEWAATLTGFLDSDEKLARKDKELELATHIFVASSFTAQTLNDYPGELPPVSVIPYGFPKPIKKREYSNLTGPLKVLFVGGLSQRKGIANLFEVAENLGTQIDLTLVGKKPVDNCTALNDNLLKHRWIPSLTHQEVLALMRTKDILVFPSLFEGFGLVVTEAMSQGTPVITTDRTCGPDLISHGKNGWIVEAGSSEALQNQIEEILQNRPYIKQVGEAALMTAKSRPWKVYGQELTETILSLEHKISE